MADELKRFIEELDEPIFVSAKAFLRDFQSGRVRLRRATMEVADDFLTQDKVAFKFDTDGGAYVFPYAPRLNAALLRLGIKMNESSIEAIRIGMLVTDNLRLPDARFGKHFTDSVLWPILNERFGQVRAIREVLAELPHHSPDAGEAYEECDQYLRNAIVGVGNSIVVELGYAEPTAFAILAGAVLFMLDRRHHISERRILFPK